MALSALMGDGDGRTLLIRLRRLLRRWYAARALTEAVEREVSIAADELRKRSSSDLTTTRRA